MLNDEEDVPSGRIGTSAAVPTQLVRRDTPFVKEDRRPSRVSFVDTEESTPRRDTPYVKQLDVDKTSPKMAPRVSFAPKMIEETAMKLENRRNTPFHNQDVITGRPSSLVHYC